MEADGTVDAQTAPTAPWETLRVFHELPQGTIFIKSPTKNPEEPKKETEKNYRTLDSKIQELDTRLPRIKTQIREFFELSATVKAVFLQIDDFYHLNRAPGSLDTG